MTAAYSILRSFTAKAAIRMIIDAKSASECAIRMANLRRPSKDMIRDADPAAC